MIAIAAPSGTGKTSVIREILKIYKDSMIFSISATTRKKRGNEVDGVDYFFLTEEEFKRRIEENDFIEWERIYNDYYGTLRSEIEKMLATGKSILFELDVKGSDSLKSFYPEAVSIFLFPPSLEELEKRLRNRKTESDETIQKRMERVKMELEQALHFDHKIVNDDLQKTVNTVKEIIEELINK
jgi:guanylate kinase